MSWAAVVVLVALAYALGREGFAVIVLVAALGAKAALGPRGRR